MSCPCGEWLLRWMPVIVFAAALQPRLAMLITGPRITIGVGGIARSNTVGHQLSISVRIAAEIHSGNCPLIAPPPCSWDSPADGVWLNDIGHTWDRPFQPTRFDHV